MSENSFRFPWDVEPKTQKPRLATDFTYEDLVLRFKEWGLKPANVDQFFRGFYKLGFRNPDDFEAVLLPKRLREDLKKGALPLSPFAKTAVHPSSDGSKKYVFTLYSGHAIESVYMPFEGRTTICVSSQVGCAMGCTFCATGKMGLKRHLSAGEIVGQVTEILADHPSPNGQQNLLNVVFMGMGEPLHNLKGVMRSFEIMTHPKGLNISQRDIGVSTSGLVPKIKELATYERRPHLMVSIAATSNEARSSIMPVNRAYDLEELADCLRNYPLRKREKIMLSYVVIKGINDRPEDVERLATFAQGFPNMINLIPMNAHEQSPGMEEPDEEHLESFTRALLDRGLFVTIRRSKGRDVAAACGQLVQNPIIL